MLCGKLHCHKVLIWFPFHVKPQVTIIGNDYASYSHKVHGQHVQHHEVPPLPHPPSLLSSCIVLLQRFLQRGLALPAVVKPLDLSNIMPSDSVQKGGREQLPLDLSN